MLTLDILGYTCIQNLKTQPFQESGQGRAGGTSGREVDPVQRPVVMGGAPIGAGGT